MEPLLYQFEWDVALEVLFTIILLSFFVERALSLVFENRWHDAPLGNSRGDKGPDHYLPPNDAYRCDYVTNFLAVKHEWGLRVTPTEQSAADTVLADCPGE